MQGGTADQLWKSLTGFWVAGFLGGLLIDHSAGWVFMGAGLAMAIGAVRRLARPERQEASPASDTP